MPTSLRSFGPSRVGLPSMLLTTGRTGGCVHGTRIQGMGCGCRLGRLTTCVQRFAVRHRLPSTELFSRQPFSRQLAMPFGVLPAPRDDENGWLRLDANSRYRTLDVESRRPLPPARDSLQRGRGGEGTSEFGVGCSALDIRRIFGAVVHAATRHPEMMKMVGRLGFRTLDHSDFGFVSDFELRASSLPFSEQGRWLRRLLSSATSASPR
jgi:hypothetical protein